MTVQSQSQGGDSVQLDQGSQGQSQAQMTQERVAVAGKEYSSLAELAKDYDALNKEFHKRNQSKPVQQESSSELEDAKRALKELGVVTRDELEAIEARRAQDSHIDAVLYRNPDLSERKDEIRELMSLSSNQNMAVEDVIAKYNLKPSNKLARAKSGGDIVGNMPQLNNEATKFADMTPEEQGKWLDGLGRPGYTIAK